MGLPLAVLLTTGSASGAPVVMQDAEPGGNSMAEPSPVDTSVVAPEPFGGSVPLGPLRVAERNPLYHLFLTPTVEGTQVLAGGEWKVGLASAYSNIFEYNFSDAFEQRFDLERSSTVVSLARGLGAGFELGVSIGVQHNWGGFLDPAIQEIHDLFGLPNADREKVENGQFGVYLGSRVGAPEVYLDLPPGTGLEAPRVWAAWQVAGGPHTRSGVTLRTTVKLPAGDHRASSRGTDVAAELAVRRSWGRTHLHLSGGIVRFGLPDALAPIMREGAWFGSAGVERGLSDSVSILGQFFGGSRYAAGFGFGELDNLPLNLGIGLRGRAGAGWAWQVSFTEDVPPNSPSVDFTLDLALTRTWSPG
jgi:hypothetical protein